MTRNFFETSHGKGVSDGLGSVVKNSCFRAVVSGKVLLNNAEAVYKFCNNKLAHGPQMRSDNEVSKWDFVYTSEVSHDRHETNVDTLKGCRQLHSRT